MSETDSSGIMLTSKTMRIIHEAVDAGEFESSAEALEDAVRVWQRQRVDKIERLSVMRERIHRSLTDPQPSLTRAEVEAELDRFTQEQAQSPRHVAR